MKKIIIIFIFLTFFSVSINPSQATVKVFKNCAELNRLYPGGVAKVGAVNQGGLTKNEPKYDNALYSANKKSDRDKDGISCEK